MASATRSVKGRRALSLEATREALLDAATDLFVDRGFSSTTLVDVAARAEASRGAVYHHFEDKAALYEAVMERQGTGAVAAIGDAIGEATDPWDAALKALDAFLEKCCDRDYATIVWKEGPAALGWERWRSCEQRFGYGLTRELVRGLVQEGYIAPAPLEAMTRMVFAMIGEAGLHVAEAQTPSGQQTAKSESLELLTRFLEGIRIK